MGLLDRPLSELSGARRAALVMEAYGGKALGALGRVLMFPLRLLPFWPKKKRLTDTYLSDPAIIARSLLPARGSSASAPSGEPDEAAT
jgi:hypothetical protein